MVLYGTEEQYRKMPGLFRPPEELHEVIYRLLIELTKIPIEKRTEESSGLLTLIKQFQNQPEP